MRRKHDICICNIRCSLLSERVLLAGTHSQAVHGQTCMAGLSDRPDFLLVMYGLQVATNPLAWLEVRTELGR